MFGDKAFEIIKEFKRSPETIPEFNDDGVRQVLEEIKGIFEENCQQAATYSASGNRDLWPLLNYRHAALQRNVRCLLAYLYARLEKIRTIRWEFGPVIPDDIKKCLCEPELNFFNSYSKSLATYMKSIDEGGSGIDLTINLKPPKSLFVEVRCVQDYGLFELENGNTILLKTNSQHYLPRNEIEPLIQQGILKHIE